MNADRRWLPGGAAEGESGRSERDPLLRWLVCPVDKAGLERDGEVLVCTACGRRYPIEDGIPHMLIEPGA